MIETALFIIILVLINAPAWTYALTGVFFALTLINRIELTKKRKILKEIIDKVLSALQDD